MEVFGAIASCATIAKVVTKTYEFGDKMRDPQGLWREYVTSLEMLKKVSLGVGPPQFVPLSTY